MKKIAFAHKWEQKNRATSWSGTPYGIYRALEAHYEVVDRPLTLSPLQKLNIYAAMAKDRFFGRSDLGYVSCAERSKLLQREAITEEEEAVLVFGEMMSKSIEKTYVYQDLTVPFLLDSIARGDSALQYSGFPQQVSERVAEKRLSQVLPFYDRCAGLLTMSEWLCDYMKKSGTIAPEKVHFVGGGCNIDVSRIDHSRKTGNKFLFVGKDFRRKNGALVIEAFRKLHERHPEAMLYIAGPANVEICGELGPGVTFLGRLTYSELIDYYNLCDYFVMPSRFEAYGLVFGEALSFGLPSIGKNCFAMPEFIKEGENGYLIEHEDADELADKMEAMLIDREMADRVMKDQATYIARYSWKAVGERISAVFEGK